MAQAMGGNGQLAGEIIATTSAGCAVSTLSADSFLRGLWLCRLIFSLQLFGSIILTS